MAQANNSDPFAIDAALDEVRKPAMGRIRLAGGLVIAAIAAAAIAVPLIAIKDRKLEMVADLDRALNILAAGRAEVIGTWLDGNAGQTGRIVDSELFRLFSTEMDLAGGDVSVLITQEQGGSTVAVQSELGAPLINQLPFMERVLTDFVISVDFLAGYLVSRNGVAYVASGGAEPLQAAQQSLAAQVFASGDRVYGPIRIAANSLVIDLGLPVMEAQREPGDGQTVAAMIFTLPVTTKLAELLEPRPGAPAGESMSLVQVDGDRHVVVEPGVTPPLRDTDYEALTGLDAIMPFAKRAGVLTGGPVYSAGTAIPGSPWWLVQEIDVAAAEAELQEFKTAAAAIAVLLVLAVVLAFGAFWWRLTMSYNRALAEQFRNLAARIAKQKRLLDGINGSISEHIGLKSLDGTYRYVNPAFASAVAREPEAIIGLDDAALFGQGTAQRLKLSDERAVDSRAAVTAEEEVYLCAERHRLQISKVPFSGENGQVSGVISVGRDVTELVEQREKNEKAVRQTVQALILAIEMRDPYLAGHSRRIAEFAVEVAKRHGATADEIATAETAANLSQIGKLAVPRQILAKPARLDRDEIVEMRRHVEHAQSILHEIDFGLPVLETIAQMYERIDGKGYPKGLADDRISLTAQIVGLCDVFCARVEPRAHRAGITPRQALEILEQNPNRYDPTLVALLRDVAESVTGEKLIAGAQRH